MFFYLVLLLGSVYSQILTQLDPKSCAGLWGGSITLSLQGKDVQALVYNYKDEHHILQENGVFVRCDTQKGQNPACSPGQNGTIGFHPNHSIDSFVFKNASMLPVVYNANATGLYCVYSTSLGALDYSLALDYKNPYGLLPATFYPALLFYQGICIVYLLLGIFWTVGCIYHKDILPIQKFVSGLFGFLVVETAFNYVGLWVCSHVVDLRQLQSNGDFVHASARLYRDLERWSE